ncbi:hypothetical protein [Salinibacillus xinjiangensis]|uniref:Uncharacterized protein n=1 Tax=Salinibacillus xinjiangensis TaxID=1229268 RepID=A0A6G1XAR4_9BACI|nr:hypothetical protein [Salinibacillus xinjiangensis]MRG88074.1 hypothetical protein [Salinibacillus xinjiangensis]
MGEKKNPKNHKVKAYQEINEEITKEEELKKKRPTPQPQDFEDIEY